jgi:hypothetical protein
MSQPAQVARTHTRSEVGVPAVSSTRPEPQTENGRHILALPILENVPIVQFWQVRSEEGLPGSSSNVPWRQYLNPLHFLEPAVAENVPKEQFWQAPDVTLRNWPTSQFVWAAASCATRDKMATKTMTLNIDPERK